jgi:hypothetical protein
MRGFVVSDFLDALTNQFLLVGVLVSVIVTLVLNEAAYMAEIIRGGGRRRPRRSPRPSSRRHCRAETKQPAGGDGGLLGTSQANQLS